ncbi:MAG: signal peptidase type [Patescibacteria group bacterium]|nr:signal peptidase type [Patescibacteria group bacterium]
MHQDYRLIRHFMSTASLLHFNRIIPILAVTAIGLALFFFVLSDFKLLFIRSGSMEPELPTGSLIFIKPAPAYEVRDIIAYKGPANEIITHRIKTKILENKQSIYITQGDANSIQDLAPVSESSILGKHYSSIPWIGYAAGYAKTLPGLILITIAILFLAKKTHHA